MLLRHIRARPWLNAAHLPGEELAVTEHGQAVHVDAGRGGDAGFRQTLLQGYVPR